MMYKGVLSKKIIDKYKESLGLKNYIYNLKVKKHNIIA